MQEKHSKKGFNIFKWKKEFTIITIMILKDSNSYNMKNDN